MPRQDPKVRGKNFNEVAVGYSAEQAQAEASRCIQCPKHPCIEGCPVGVDIPDLTIPRLFEYIFGVTVDLQNFGGVFLVLSVLIVPLYFIITSSFKFLSVSLVAEKTKEDTQAFFFLISSAFILIITQIFADISALPEFLIDGQHYEFLPLQGVKIPSTFIPFISKVFESLEAIGFYTGAIVSFFILIKLGISKLFGR